MSAHDCASTNVGRRQNMPRTWVYDPHSGGGKIPMTVRERTKNRILAHASKHYAGKYTRLDVHFRGQLCYIDAYTEPAVPPGFDSTVFGESREEYLQRLRILLFTSAVSAILAMSS